MHAVRKWELFDKVALITVEESHGTGTFKSTRKPISIIGANMQLIAKNIFFACIIGAFNLLLSHSWSRNGFEPGHKCQNNRAEYYFKYKSEFGYKYKTNKRKSK